MTTQYFNMAVDAILKNWTALQLAVSQNAAGVNSKEISDWMTDATVQWFSENSELEPYEVTEFLETIINQEFNVLIEDGSSAEIGVLICDFYNLIEIQKKTQDEILTKLRALPKCNLDACQIEDGDIQSPISNVTNHLNELNVSNDDDNNSSANGADPDGWVTVTTKKKNK